MSRPRPPAELISSEFDADTPRHIHFVPAHELTTWLSETFIAEGATLGNDDHSHLRMASIGALWTDVGNSRSGKRIVGQAEFSKNAGGSQGKWGRARSQQQTEEWFGCVPDFILTFDAGYAASCSDDEFCALVEHELYHCGQERDVFGAPRFSQNGLPAFCLRGHDVEEFIGVVRRYGADAAHVRALVDAASQEPEIGKAAVAGACGNCLMPRLVSVR